MPESFPGPLEQIGPRKVGQRMVVFEITVSAESASVNHSLRNPLVIEVEDLFPKVEVLQRGRAARANFQRILIVRNRHPLLSGQRGNISVRGLVSLTAGAESFIDGPGTIFHVAVGRFSAFVSVANYFLRHAWLPLYSKFGMNSANTR